MLTLGMGAQAASCVFLYGLPYLVPDLRHQLGPVLAQPIGLSGYGGAFGIGALFPIAAILAIPIRSERPANPALAPPPPPSPPAPRDRARPPPRFAPL